MNPVKEEISRLTNPEKLNGGLENAFSGADLFIGVSGWGNCYRGYGSFHGKRCNSNGYGKPRTRDHA